MDKNQLIKSANRLKQVSEKAGQEYADKSDALTARMNRVMLLRPDVEILVGKKNIDMMKDNHANHVRFMTSVFFAMNSDVLVETILWVFRAYRSHGFASSYWAAQINTWIGILRDDLSPECFSEIYPYYYWIQINIPVFELLSQQEAQSFISSQ